MKRWLLAGAVALTCVATGQVPIPGQPDKGTPSIETTSSLPLSYVGGDQRVSIGIDKDGNTQGELLGVFANNGERAIVAQGWWDHGGAGGAQFDYNWLFGRTLDEVRKDPASAIVAKLSFAADQNQDKDRRATLGFAVERKEFFLNAFLSRSISGARDSGAISNTVVTNTSGTDAAGNFVQTQTETTTTQLRAQPYNYSFGVHAGHFLDSINARFVGGVDYDRGNQGAHGTRYSVSLDKYLGTHGWSVSGQGEHSSQKNPFGPNRSDNRWWLSLRYEFGGGGAFQPSDQVADTAWIQRALHNPLSGHARTITTYSTRGKNTKTITPGTKTYTAHRPVARDDSATVLQNSINNPIDVLANDSDPDGNPISITAVTQPGHGTAQIAGSLINYTPATGFAGTDQFNYTISDNKNLSATATVTVTVTTTPPAQTKPPIAQNVSATAAYNTPVTINVLANDSDPNGYPLSVTSVTLPSHGIAAINSNSTITYSPQTNYLGTDSFGYTISNGKGGSASATVTVVVLPPAGQLIARDDTATTAYNTPVSIDVLANDSAPPGRTLTIVGVTQASNGTTQIINNSITYSPAAGFYGTDSFTYTVSDGMSSAKATVTVTVLTAPAPIARDGVITTTSGKPATINVLINDFDPNGLSLTLLGVATPSHGTASFTPSGSVTYTPQAGYIGTDSFAYLITNGAGGFARATVRVTILAALLPPVAANNAATTPYNTPVTINVLANASDPNGLPLSVIGTTAPARGTTQINGNNTITYTPNAGFVGSDSFNYTIRNSAGLTASAAVSVTVQIPPAPVAVADTINAPPTGTTTIPVLANDINPAGLALTITAITQSTPSGQIYTVGSVAISPGAQSLTFTPSGFAGAGGSLIGTYTITDPFGRTSTAAFTVTIQIPVVNGACGTSNGLILPTAPSTNLCSAGSSSAVSGNGHPWSWTCGGSGGGSTASCSATIQQWTVSTATSPSPNPASTVTFTPTSRTVDNGQTTTFSISSAGSRCAANSPSLQFTVSGCSGSPNALPPASSITYTTGAVTANCTVTVSCP